MEECVPAPVIDVARQARIETVTAPGILNPFNILAIVVIALAAFFLFKRYKDKQAVETAHMLRPSPVIPTPVPTAEVQDQT